MGTASALGLARFAFGLLVPGMSDDLGWTLGDAGVVSAVNGLGYLLGALAATAVVRRVGTAGTFRGAMVLIAVALTITAASDNFVFLLIVRAVAGAAGALVFITGGVIASRLASRAAITIYFAGTGLGIVFAGVAVPLVETDWRLAWLCIGIAAGAAALGSWTAASGGDDAGSKAGRPRVRSLRGLALAYFLFATGYIAYITFLSAFLADQGAPVWQVILTWAALGLAVALAPALWIHPIMAWPGNRALVVLLAALGVGAALALPAPSLVTILASVLVYGATFMCVPAAVTAIIKRTVPAADRTATLAAFTMIFAAGQTIGPWVAEVVADHSSSDAPLVWTAALSVTAAAIAWISGRSWRGGRPIDALAPEEDEHNNG